MELRQVFIFVATTLGVPGCMSAFTGSSERVEAISIQPPAGNSFYFCQRSPMEKPVMTGSYRYAGSYSLTFSYDWAYMKRATQPDITIYQASDLPVPPTIIFRTASSSQAFEAKSMLPSSSTPLALLSPTAKQIPFFVTAAIENCEAGFLTLGSSQAVRSTTLPDGSIVARVPPTSDPEIPLKWMHGLAQN